MRDLAGFALLLAALVLALYVLVSFVFPFVATYLLGMAVFFGLAMAVLRRGRLHPGHLECLLNPGGPTFLVLAAIAFGLSTDYGVFLLSRIKEAHDAGRSTDDAVIEGLAHTGRLVTSAATSNLPPADDNRPNKSY